MTDNFRLFRFFFIALGFIKWKLLGVNMPFSITRPVKMHRHVRIQRPRKVTLGHCVTLFPYSYLKSAPGEIKIGSFTSIGEFTYINSGESVTIGENVLIAPSCHITDSNHGTSRHATINSQKRKCEPVVIGDDVWIGAGSKILPGVNIGKGSVIGAGSVVTRDIPPYKIAVGVPAKVIRDR